MLFMVACLFRARGLFVYCRRLAVHAGCCSGFLRELELGRLFWSPPAARAVPSTWALDPKASLLVGGALCLTYGCVFDRGRAQLVASALPTLACAANLAFVTGSYAVRVILCYLADAV